MDVFAEVLGAVAVILIVLILVRDTEGLFSMRGRIAWSLMTGQQRAGMAFLMFAFWPFLSVVYLALFYLDYKRSRSPAMIQKRIAQLERELGIGNEHDEVVESSD